MGPYANTNGGGGLSMANQMNSYEDGKIYTLVIDLMDPSTRETALLELSKKREQYDDLALVLWHSFGEFRWQIPRCRTDTDL